MEWGHVSQALYFQKIFAELQAQGFAVVETSTLTEEGVMKVKTEVNISCQQDSELCLLSLPRVGGGCWLTSTSRDQTLQHSGEPHPGSGPSLWQSRAALLFRSVLVPFEPPVSSPVCMGWHCTRPLAWPPWRGRAVPVLLGPFDFIFLHLRLVTGFWLTELKPK